MMELPTLEDRPAPLAPLMPGTDRPVTTLFLLSSVDGKIAPGDCDELDVERDFKELPGLGEGLGQYYELEGQTDLFSLNSGRTWAKIGFNQRAGVAERLPVSYIVIDNRPHLTEAGVLYASRRAKRLIVVTANPHHPAIALAVPGSNIEVLRAEAPADFRELFARLKSDYGVKRLTLQTGGMLNAQFLRLGLIDHLSLVVAPVSVGGRATPGIFDGESLAHRGELSYLKAMTLRSCRVLRDSFLHLEYDLIKG